MHSLIAKFCPNVIGAHASTFSARHVRRSRPHENAARTRSRRSLRSLLRVLLLLWLLSGLQIGIQRLSVAHIDIHRPHLKTRIQHRVAAGTLDVLVPCTL